MLENGGGSINNNVSVTVSPDMKKKLNEKEEELNN